MCMSSLCDYHTFLGFGLFAVMASRDHQQREAPRTSFFSHWTWVALPNMPRHPGPSRRTVYGIVPYTNLRVMRWSGILLPDDPRDVSKKMTISFHVKRGVGLSHKKEQENCGRLDRSHEIIRIIIIRKRQPFVRWWSGKLLCNVAKQYFQSNTFLYSYQRIII